jgi:hypothetical protein
MNVKGKVARDFLSYSILSKVQNEKFVILSFYTRWVGLGQTTISSNCLFKAADLLGHFREHTDVLTLL